MKKLINQFLIIALYTFGAFVIIYPFVYWILNAYLTGIEIFIHFWPYYLGFIISAVLIIRRVEKCE